MMKTIRWLLTLAKGSPLIFSLALLLIGIVAMLYVVKYQEEKIKSCELEKVLLQKRLDSLNTYYISREIKLNGDVKEVLNLIIANYKDQLAEQEKTNKAFIDALNKNR